MSKGRSCGPAFPLSLSAIWDVNPCPRPRLADAPLAPRVDRRPTLPARNRAASPEPEAGGLSGRIDSAPYFYHNGDIDKSDAIAALAALAQDSRLDIFRLLVQAGPVGLPAGRIGERLGLPSATLSFHLSQLRHAGLVMFRRESRSLIYAAEYSTMSKLLGYLTENCCQGDPGDATLASALPPRPVKKGKRNEAPTRARVR